mmetsp:Transcript_31261/g.80203  ORF Transcript_31261/g.80203 Transcript_31261/m.80203 type:complete len:236 (+) Transcript_31261:1205-1912(+)
MATAMRCIKWSPRPATWAATRTRTAMHFKRRGAVSPWSNALPPPGPRALPGLACRTLRCTGAISWTAGSAPLMRGSPKCQKTWSADPRPGTPQPGVVYTSTTAIVSAPRCTCSPSPPGSWAATASLRPRASAKPSPSPSGASPWRAAPLLRSGQAQTGSATSGSGTPRVRLDTTWTAGSETLTLTRKTWCPESTVAGSFGVQACTGKTSCTKGLLNTLRCTNTLVDLCRICDPLF